MVNLSHRASVRLIAVEVQPDDGEVLALLQGDPDAFAITLPGHVPREAGRQRFGNQNDRFHKEDAMRIATIGRGHVGGGLARRWEKAGHTVTLLGRGGGDVSDADVVLVAVPSTAITDALAKVTGLDGKVALDATLPLAGRNPGYASLAHEVKAHTNGPVAKASAFYAPLLDDIDKQRARPSLLYAADDGARQVTEQLIRDAGFDPVGIGGIDGARALEDFVTGLLVKIGQVFYRFAPPGDL